ncbi:polysaccharide deacetylase family protein [Nocardia arthritidis]|nr:polysaccharide deacetylase family protein [Nocardia arthritidis]
MTRPFALGSRICSAIMVFLIAGCGAPAPRPPAETSSAAPQAASAAAPIDADELGVVPILMYHQVVADPLGEYDQTPDKFRAELERLHREGYRPVTVSDYRSGHLDLPAGTHPVVLTFDDSTRSQLTLAEGGAPTPDCAVGILQEFGARNPDFRPTATFYVNNDPFGGDPRALPWLAAHGYEIGAHTATHANLGRLDRAGVQRELVQNLRAIEAAVPGVAVRTMALPLGVYPADRALATSGSWDGRDYRFDAVLLVGAEPAPSPYGRLDPAALPRIRSGRTRVAFDSGYWLDRLAANPDQRYTSDGGTATVSFPKSRAAELNPQWASRARPY